MTTGSITWTTAGFVQEKATLDAFVTLLGRDCQLAPKDVLDLHGLCGLSRERQGEVADRLGVQVRDGLERLLLAWDRADRESDGTVLAGMTEDQIYEMGLVVLMRLVFLLYAEERALLPHGEMLYDQGYGLTFLWHRLLEQKREREATLDQTFDAWDRLLATGRLLHRGCTHPDLNLRAYGGQLFDPARFPALEKPGCWVANRTLYEVLHGLLFARQRRGGELQRVGYWAL
ncbi:MAG: restriction endonuclease, partial [Deltaproteobacteria bacterium]|nr:restriction endonuclease [Deltaproteobacteria bacterium]